MSDSQEPLGIHLSDRVGLETRSPTVRKRSGVRSIVNRLGGEYYTTSEVANILGVSQGTLRRWYRSPSLGHKAPSKKLTRGKMVIYLYTPEDLEELRKYISGESE